MRAWRKKTTACQEATEACVESTEPTSVETESVVVHEVVPKEEAAVQTFRALKERYEDRYLAVEHRRQLKKRTQGDGGSRKKLTAACRRMTHRAGTARRKGRCHKGPTVDQRRRKYRTRDKVARGTSKGRTFGKRRRAQPECNNGVRNRDLKERLRLGSRRTFGRIFRKTVELEIAKQTVGTSIGLQKMSDRILWRSRPPPKRKKRLYTE
jgi:hypothetical protein